MLNGYNIFMRKQLVKNREYGVYCFWIDLRLIAPTNSLPIAMLKKFLLSIFARIPPTFFNP